MAVKAKVDPLKTCYGNDKPSFSKHNWDRAYASMFDIPNVDRQIHSQYQKLPDKINLPRFNKPDAEFITLAVYGNVEVSGRFTRPTVQGDKVHTDSLAIVKQAFETIRDCCKAFPCHGGEVQYKWSSQERVIYKAETPKIVSPQTVITAQDFSVEHIYKGYNEVFLIDTAKSDFHFGGVAVSDRGTLSMTSQSELAAHANGTEFYFKIEDHVDPPIKLELQFGSMTSFMAQVISSMSFLTGKEVHCKAGYGAFHFAPDPNDMSGYKFPADPRDQNVHTLHVGYRGPLTTHS
ncbi:unnamed protein product [Calypogeia fissa]